MIAGYSMGGYGAYKLASQFPDLFARVQTTVGPPGISQRAIRDRCCRRFATSRC